MMAEQEEERKRLKQTPAGALDGSKFKLDLRICDNEGDEGDGRSLFLDGTEVGGCVQ